MYIKFCFILYSYFLAESSKNFPLSLDILIQANSKWVLHQLSECIQVSLAVQGTPNSVLLLLLLLFLSCLTASSKLDSILFAIVVVVGPKVGDAFNTWTLSSRALGQKESRVYWKRLKTEVDKDESKALINDIIVIFVKILSLGLLRNFYIQ